MAKHIIKSDKAPKAIGTYSQGIVYDKLIFTSGQIPINPETGKLIKGDFKTEVEQVLKNIDCVLKSGNSSLKKIIKLTVFITDLAFFSDVNTVFEIYFNNEPPARSVIEVSALPMNSRIEIEAIGYIQ
tara:strand:+ start:132 stop:515 length:384 start_codon:yes stop_codon:yes gene_type:complete